MRYFYIFLILLALSGCKYDITGVDLSDLENPKIQADYNYLIYLDLKNNKKTK